MKRYFRLALGSLALITVMLLSAAITLRLAIHGGEVTVPDFSGMTVAEASDMALHKSLDLTIENRFYSTTIPAGRMLSQAPAAGSRVRKHWKVRVTASLGPQQVTIPDVSGQPQREAAMGLRRSALDLGTVAHIDAPGDPDMVLAQTPPPNAGLDQPRVSLLLSSQTGDATSAVMLPSFIGMSYGGAIRAASALGIKLTYQDYNAPPPAATPTPGAAPTPSPTTPGPAGTQINTFGQAVATPVAPVVPAYTGPVGTVNGQKPEPGYRATRGMTVKIVFGHAPAAAPSSAAAQSTLPTP